MVLAIAYILGQLMDTFDVLENFENTLYKFRIVDKDVYLQNVWFTTLYEYWLDNR